MGQLKNIEVQSTLEWMNAIYVDDAGQEYEVVFTKCFDENIGCESRELANVEKDGSTISYEEPVWNEIHGQVQAVELNCSSQDSIKFTVEISKDWLEALSSLTKWVLAGSKASPEEALEIAIFSQIKEQI